jgi:hypothetical protein
MKSNIRVTKNFARERIETPKDFIPSSFRTIKEKGGHEVVVGKLKPSHRKKGYSAWHVQAILHPKKEL